MKISVFTIIALSFFTSLSAQDNYQEGFIVTDKDDTVKGSIDYRRWDISPAKIRFKSSDNASEYTPLKIRSFSVADENYVSAMVDVDVSLYKIDELDNSAEPNLFATRFFYKRCFKAKRVCIT